MKKKLAVLLAFPVLASLACGKSDAEKFADAFCAEVAKCCVQHGLPGDGQMCMLMSSGTGYNATAGEACLAEIRNEVANGTFCQSGSSSSSPCNSVYQGSTGNKQPGETCQSDNDCAKSADGQVVCASAYLNGAFVEKCQVQIPGKQGDTPCLGTQDGTIFTGDTTSTDVLARGYVCDTADGLRCSAGACVVLAAAGDICVYSSDCVGSAYCDYSQRKCVARVGNGGVCTGSDSDECVAGNYCDSAAKQCAAQLANGATCSDYSMCLSGTCTGNVCQDDLLSDFAWGFLCGSS